MLITLKKDDLDVLEMAFSDKVNFLLYKFEDGDKSLEPQIESLFSSITYIRDSKRETDDGFLIEFPNHIMIEAIDLLIFRAEKLNRLIINNVSDGYPVNEYMDSKEKSMSLFSNLITKMINQKLTKIDEQLPSEGIAVDSITNEEYEKLSKDSFQILRNKSLESVSVDPGCNFINDKNNECYDNENDLSSSRLYKNLSSQVYKIKDFLNSSNLNLVNSGCFTDDLYLVGGAVKDIIKNKMPKDLDIVLLSDNSSQIDDYLKSLNIKTDKNSFGGYKVVINNITIDIWSANDLFKVVQYNLDGLLYNITKDILIPIGYIDALEKNQCFLINKDLNHPNEERRIERYENLCKYLEEK